MGVRRFVGAFGTAAQGTWLTAAPAHSRSPPPSPPKFEESHFKNCERQAAAREPQRASRHA
eukprot:1306147-Pyramimonas_sp.AAC.1